MGGLIIKKVPEYTYRDALYHFTTYLSQVANSPLLLQALVMASSNKLENRDAIYFSTVGFFFFGTPNCGSSLGETKRVQVLSSILRVATFTLPPKIEKVLKHHSDELLDLAIEFEGMPFKEEIHMYTYYETHRLIQLGNMVSQVALIIRADKPI